MSKLTAAKNRINTVRTNDRFQAIVALGTVVAGSIAATVIASKLEKEDDEN